MLWAAVAASGLFLAAVAFVRWIEADRFRSALVAYQLGFPRQLPEEQVEAFLTGWTGTLPPAWKRWLTGSPPLVIEVRARPHSIEHFLLVPESRRRQVEALLTAHLPSVRFAPSEYVELSLTHAAEYSSSTSRRPLSIDAASLSVGLLANLQSLGRDERVVVQYVLSAHGPVQPPQVRNGKGQPWWATDPAVVDSSEAATALRRKTATSLLLGVGRIGVRAGSSSRAHGLIRQAESAWHGARAPGVHLRRRLLPLALVASRINRRVIPTFAWPGGAVNVQEAAGLVGFPIGIDHLPGLTLGGCRPLPVSQAVPSVGSVVGFGTFPSTARPVALDLDARRHNLHVVGPTGTGKSTFLANLALSDLADPNRAVVVFDLKDGQLVDSIMAAMPESRLKDLVVFDPSGHRPVGFNPLACTPDTRELVVDQVVSIMGSIWRSSWGPRSSDLIRHALLALTQVPGMTLVEAPRLLMDPTFRWSVLSRIDDPLVTASFFAWFDGLSNAEQANIVAAPANKLRQLVSNSKIRHEIGHPAPAVDLQRIINNNGVLLVRLSPGILGDGTASLLGALLTAQLWQAIASRASIAPAERRPVMVIIDEVQAVLRMPISTIEEMLSQCRGYNAGLTLAHQALTQLPTEVREAAMANTRSKLVFACSQKDAGVFAKEFGAGLTPDDLRDIEAHEAVTTLWARSRTQPPATIRLLPPATPIRPASVARDFSSRRFGTDRADVETAIQARQEPTAASNSGVGRKRRGSA